MGTFGSRAFLISSERFCSGVSGFCSFFSFGSAGALVN